MAESDAARREIAACRTRFFEAIRSDPDAWRRFAARPPLWARTGRSPLLRVYQGQEALWQSGGIVWAATVQANAALFEPGREDAPAAIVYSLEEAADGNPAELFSVAAALGSLEGRRVPDPALARLARILADETTVAFHLPVPRSVSPALEAAYTSIMVFRSHIPRGQLAMPHFPLLVCPQETDAAMILPSELWPEELLSDWREFAG